MLTFSPRPRIRRLETSRQRIFKSTDGRYKLIEVIAKDYHRWIACRILATGEYPISKHRTRQAAEAACVKHRSE